MRPLPIAATAALLIGCAPAPPAAEGTDANTRVEFMVGREGGLCATPEGGGAVCSDWITVLDDGTWTATSTAFEGEESGTVAAGAATELATIVEDRWRALTERAFTGTCPMAYDGQELVLMVRRIPTGEGAERADASVREVRSCTHDLEHSDAAAAMRQLARAWEELELSGEISVD